MKDENVTILTLTVFGIIFIIFVGVLVHGKITTGCWGIGEEKVTEFSLIKDYNYTCADLKDMILLETYPNNLNKSTTGYYCKGIKYEGYEEQGHFNFYDIKREYAGNCLGGK